MDYNLIKKLVKVIEQSEISEFSVQEGDLKIKISKNGKQQVMNPVYTQPVTEQVNNFVQPTSSLSKTEVTSPSETTNSNLHEVKSPIVGTFYSAPSPDSPSYVKVGDNVEEGSVLCIVEAMKLMNEIESDAKGRIVKILVENSTAVEYNQPLFVIEKN